MLYWIIPIAVIGVGLVVVALKRGWTTLPSMGGFTFTTPVWARTWWAANWALLMIFLPLWVVMVLLILPAMPIGYAAYAAHGGATGWLLVFLVLLLAIAFTIPQRWLRLPLAVVFVMLLFWVVVPAILWTVMGYCAPSDHVCLRKEAEVVSIKEEQQRQKQAAAQRAIEASRQPVASQCNVHRKPYRFEATRPDFKFNPGGVCSPQLFTEGHCVYVTQNNSETTLGPICNRGGGVPRDKAGNPIDMPEDIDRVWSAEGKPFDAEVGLWQPRYTKLFSWR